MRKNQLNLKLTSKNKREHIAYICIAICLLEISNYFLKSFLKSGNFGSPKKIKLVKGNPHL